MKAFYNPQTNLFELKQDSEPVPNMPKFKRFVGGIGWGREDRPGDFSKTWLALFGEQADSRITQMAEFQGTLQQVGKEAVNLKDRFLCDYLYVDASEIHNQKLLYLRTLEGLTFYEEKDDILGRTAYPTDTKTWPHFRGERPLASIVPVPDDIRTDIAAGFGLVHALATEQKQIIFAGDCERLADLIRKFQTKDRKPEETFTHPLAAASVYAISMLLRTRPVEGEQSEQKLRNPYPNRKR